MRVVSVERGSILSRSRSSTACKIPVSLGITQVLVPQFAGALSALGLLLADNVRDAAGVLGRTDYEAGFATLESQAGTLRRPELRTHPPALNSSPNPSPPRTKKCTVMAYPADSSRSSPYASGPSSRWSSRSSATPAADSPSAPPALSGSAENLTPFSLGNAIRSQPNPRPVPAESSITAPPHPSRPVEACAPTLPTACLLQRTVSNRVRL